MGPWGEILAIDTVSQNRQNTMKKIRNFTKILKIGPIYTSLESLGFAEYLKNNSIII